MKCSLLICSLLLICIKSLVAQPRSAIAKATVFKTTKGQWRFEQYASNVIKAIFTPVDYQHNEQITAAVISKPYTVFDVAFIHVDADQVFIGKNKEVQLKYTMDENNFRGFQIALKNDEMIFGGGERALPLNRRGYRFPLYNNPWYAYGEGADALNFSVPFFTSSKGYGLFFDNGSKGYADIGKKNVQIFEAGFYSGELNVYVVFGKDYPQILTTYQNLTGKQPLPPKWAMGNFMSRFGYTSEKQVKEIAGKMWKEKIPFDAVIFDLFWFGDSIKGYMGNLDWVNKKQWPNPKQMLTDFKLKKIHPILICEPYILKDSKSYSFAEPFLAKDSTGKAYQLTDFYFGKGGLIDIFRKEAGDWIWKYHYLKQIANGVDGWWTDLGEPERHPVDLLHNLKDQGVNRMMQADEVHNIYGHYWNKMLFEKYATTYPNTRLFHLNRSGFSGSQRYSIFPWTGDVNRNWTGLRAQLPNILGMSMSGIPYVHSDAGGFALGEGDAELYLRWLQFASFTPIFRPHGTALYETDPTAISYPSEPALADASVLDQVKQAVALRYQLMPYNYTLAYRQAAFGEPLIKPLYYQYPNDSNAVKVGDEFLWGDAFLVAPVLEKGANYRSVYLPKGEWYSFSNNQEIFYKDTTIKFYDVSNYRFPVFVKAGSFIPQNKGVQANIEDLKKTVLELMYYPSTKESSYQWYLDDGISKNAISAKQYELINFSTKGKSDQQLDFIIQTNGGQYVGKPLQKNLQVLIPAIKQLPASITINGKPINVIDATSVNGISTGEQAIWNFGKQQELRIPIQLVDKALQIHIVWKAP